MKNALFCSFLCCALLGVVFVVGASPSKYKTMDSKAGQSNKSASSKKDVIGGKNGTHRIGGNGTQKSASSKPRFDVDNSSKQRSKSFKSSGTGSSRWKKK